MSKNRTLLSVLAITFALISADSLAVNPSNINNLFKKKKKDFETKKLFFQSQFQRIELPQDTFLPSNSQHFISEQVSYKHADNTLTEKNKEIRKGKINEVQQLNEVIVTTKSRFTPEHNGKVNVDFVVKIPNHLISSKWRLILLPKVLHNSKYMELQPIVLKGSDFISAQAKDSLAYANYLKSIVDKSEYDSLFHDKKSLNKDICKYQSLIYNKYIDDWNRHKHYLDRMNRMQEKEFKEDVKYKSYVANTNAEIEKKIFNQKFQQSVNNKDTFGIRNAMVLKYNDQLTKRNKAYDKKNKKLMDELLSYRTTNFALSKVPHNNFTTKDSTELSRHYYDFEKIAENELRKERKDDAYKRLTRFENMEEVRLDTTINQNQNFVYTYKQSFPVTPGLKKIRVFMDARIEAIDQSGFYSPATDTLSYFIASLSQLADTSLLYKKSKLNKTAYNRVSAFLKYPQNKNSVLDINYHDNKNQLLNALLFMSAVQKNKVYAMDSVVIEVSRSLDGKFEKNANIATDQANAVRKYFEKQHRASNLTNHFVANPIGEDWNSLVKEIKSSDKIVNKDAILEMLANAKFPDECKKEIKKKYPSDYKIIEDEIFPYMNRTDIVFYVHRTDMKQEKEKRVEYRGDNYAEGLRLLQEREYWKALKLLADYGDYNTALCLVCLGYNGKAYELIEKLPKTAESLYLKAIVANRLDKKSEAVQCLKESIRMDPSKQYRIGLDAEAKEIATSMNEEIASIEE